MDDSEDELEAEDVEDSGVDDSEDELEAEDDEDSGVDDSAENDAFSLLKKMPGEKTTSFYKTIEDEIKQLSEEVKGHEEIIGNIRQEAERILPVFLLNITRHYKNQQTDRIFKGVGADPYEQVLFDTPKDHWIPIEFRKFQDQLKEPQSRNKQQEATLETYKDMWLSYWYPRFHDKKDIERNKEKTVDVFEEWLNSRSWGKKDNRKMVALDYFRDNFGVIPYKKNIENTFLLWCFGRNKVDLPQAFVRSAFLELRIRLMGIPSVYLQKCEQYVWSYFVEKIKSQFGQVTEETIRQYFSNSVEWEYGGNIELAKELQARIREKLRLIHETRKKEKIKKDKYLKLTINEKQQLWSHYLNKKRHEKSMELMDSEIEQHRRLEEIAEEESEQRLQLEQAMMNIEIQKQRREEFENNRLRKVQMKAAEESQRIARQPLNIIQKQQNSHSSESGSTKRHAQKPITNHGSHSSKREFAYALQQGSKVCFFDNFNSMTRSIPGILKGYTKDTVQIQNGNTITIHNSNGSIQRSFRA